MELKSPLPPPPPPPDFLNEYIGQRQRKERERMRRDGHFKVLIYCTNVNNDVGD